jgi:hypothetical protein
VTERVVAEVGAMRRAQRPKFFESLRYKLAT